MEMHNKPCDRPSASNHQALSNSLGLLCASFASLSSGVIKILMTLHVPSDNCLTVRGFHPNVSISGQFIDTLFKRVDFVNSFDLCQS